jgi:hypothetical protein
MRPLSSLFLDVVVLFMFFAVVLAPGAEPAGQVATGTKAHGECFLQQIRSED